MAGEWAGEVVFILAGGPSVENLNLSLLQGRRVIAINSAWRTYPTADVLFFADDRWWRELGKIALGGNGEGFAGELLTTSKSRPPRATFRKRSNPKEGLSSKPDTLAMERTSVSAAINEAVHRGARLIVLLGVDGKFSQDGRTHNHGEKYRWPFVKGSFDEHQVEFAAIATSLKEVKVINANTDSKISVWPKMNFEEVLRMVDRDVVREPSADGWPVEDTVRVFVGCAANGEDAESQAVLEWSLRKHTSLPIEITWMMQSRDPDSFWHGFNSSFWKTPFSGLRWAVPAACNFAGRAIYMDSDVIAMADIAELWRQDMKGNAVLAKFGGRLCVSLWDCKAAHQFVLPIDQLKANPSAHKQMQNLTRQNPRGLLGVFDGDWNCLDGEGHADLNDGEVKAIHYTEMSCQPHLNRAVARLEAVGQKHWMDGARRPHPRKDLQHLFDELLEEAIGEGFMVENYLPEVLFGAYDKASLKNYTGAQVRVPPKVRSPMPRR